MSTPCEFEELDCPEPENYAAIAKQLHETAQQAEDRVYCIEKLLRYAVNRETYVATTTTTMGSFSSSDGTNPLTGSAIFTSGQPLTVNFANFPVEQIRLSGGQWLIPAGVWHIGVYGASFCVGAASDNTYRQIRIRRSRVNPLNGSLDTLNEIAHTSFESANGVQILMNASGVLRIDLDDRITFTFRHGNTASNVSIDVGAIVWFTKLSEADVSRVI
jgi:hypothetical protein